MKASFKRKRTRGVPVLFMAAVLFFSNFLPFAAYAQEGIIDGTYNFSGLGAADSAGQGFQRVGDKFKVTNGVVTSSESPDTFQQDSLRLNYMTRPDFVGNLTLLAEGGTINQSFTFNDLGLSTNTIYGSNGQLQRLKVTLKDSNNDDIAVLENNNVLVIPSDKTVKLSSILQNGSPYEFEKVSSIDIEWEYAGDPPESLNFDNITLSDISDAPTAEAPVISSQPVSQTVDFKSPTVLSVTANPPSSGTLSYQWYRNDTSTTTGGIAIQNANSNTYTVPTNASGPYYYYVIVTNTTEQSGNPITASTTSQVATVTVREATNAQVPTITRQPEGVNVNTGDPASLSVSATAPQGGTLSYQWYRMDSDIVGEEDGTPITGATQSTYSAPTQNAGVQTYYVVVTNTDNSQTGNKTATVRSQQATVTVKERTDAQAPTITLQPKDVTVNMEETATLSVTATAPEGGTLSYQWYRVDSDIAGDEGTLISGATESSYTAPTDNLGVQSYYVVVTNTDDSKTGNKTATVRSQTANVFVNERTNAQAPTITSEPQDEMVYIGQSATLSVEASVPGEGVLSYQWYQVVESDNQNGQEILGANNATYTTTAFKQAGTRSYYVVVTNTDDSRTGNKTATSTSRTAVVTVNDLPHGPGSPIITTQPQDRTVTVGTPVTLTVTATASAISFEEPMLRYQWYRNTTQSTTNAVPIEGANSPSYSVPTSSVGTAYYYVVVTNEEPRRLSDSISVNQIIESKAATSRVARVTVTPVQGNPNPPSNPTPAVPDPVVTPAPTTPAPAPTPASGVDVLVNGVPQNVGTATTTQENGQSVTTIRVNEETLQQRLNEAGNGAVLTIPVTDQSDAVVGEISGRMINNLEQSDATLRIQTPRASYTIPAEEINVNELASAFGSGTPLQDVAVRVRIAVSNADTTEQVQQTASSQGFDIVAPPMDFEIQAVYDGNVRPVTDFDRYVERTITLPQSVASNLVTTAIVFNSNGSLHSVPTKVRRIDGVLQAIVNSRSNSTYVLVSNPVSFQDTSGHWSEDIVKDMASRWVMEGASAQMFMPNRNATRAEFASALVSGLGLESRGSGSTFSDVNSNNPFYQDINTAVEYGLVDGFANGTFRPDEMLTREQAMQMLTRAMSLTGLSEGTSVSTNLSAFRDNDQLADWAREGAAASVSAGIIEGRKTDLLVPKGWLTRAETAAIVQRLLQRSDLI